METMHVFVFLALIMQCLGDFLTDLKHLRSCNESSPISLEVLNGVLINQKLPKDESGNFQCFLFCLFTKYKWMDEDGGFLVHEIKTVLEEVKVANLKQILYKCTAVDSFNGCKRAFAFTKCFWGFIGAQKEDVDDELLYQVIEA
ncbi:hypothetical protein RN001_011270 [Aquatica leii]|uniref:Uncharacterized protein n=1 Tax=Aquatica leii TaxID=1421715 RepID=A0AAN7PVT4_9COLE|nr:hypothetical protein RN001_011270 [Aquatica leii]